MAVLVDLTKCIGCESCSVACKLWNKLPYGRKKSRSQKEKDLNDDNWTVIQEKHVEAENGKAYTRFVKKQCTVPCCLAAGLLALAVVGGIFAELQNVAQIRIDRIFAAPELHF